MGDEVALTSRRAHDAPDAALLAALLAQTPAALGVWDSARRVVLHNAALDALAERLAHGPSQSASEALLALPSAALIDRVLAGETLSFGPLWVPTQRHDNGSELATRLALEGSLFPIRDSTGRISHAGGLFRDASRELSLGASEARLDEAERRLHLMLDNAPIALVSMDLEGRYTCLEGQRLRTMGMRSADLLGRSAFELAKDQPNVREALRRALLGESVTFRGESIAGGTHESHVVPQFGADGKVCGLTAISYDVTEREHAEQALRQSEENLRRALHAGRLLTIEIDFSAGTMLLSPNAPQVFGASLEQLSDMKRAMALIHPDDLGKAQSSLALALQQGSSVPDIQYRIVRPDNGAIVWCERRLVFKRDAQGNVVGASGLLIDVTEQKRAEEMDARAAELMLENRRMEAASRLKSEFLANMSHELRTPLNAILGFSELLLDGHVQPGSTHYREFLRDILLSGQHLLRLVNDVLDLAKVESGKQDFHPESVSIRALVNEVCTALEASALHKHIVIQQRLDPELDRVTLDPARFKQVLFNYLSNALKFTPRAGCVTVRTLIESAALFRLEVEDNGIGIAARDVGRLFSEFQQLDTGTNKKHQGTGLGLVLTRRLVEAQGGTVSVRSEPGSGSVFAATLPRHTPCTRGSE